MDWSSFVLGMIALASVVMFLAWLGRTDGNIVRLAANKKLIAALDDLVIMTDAKDRAEVVSKALAVYDCIIHLRVGDNKVVLVDKNGKFITEIVIQ